MKVGKYLCSNNLYLQLETTSKFSNADMLQTIFKNLDMIIVCFFKMLFLLMSFFKKRSPHIKYASSPPTISNH